jgi:fibronectin type 3 domain-containing protein
MPLDVLTPRVFQNKDGAQPVDDRTTVGTHASAGALNAESQAVADAVRRLQGSVLGAKANYGAVGDAIEITATINVATSATTVNATQFTSAHVNKTVAIPGAGASNANLVATVTGVTPGVSATISTPASTSVTAVDGYVGTDDTAAFMALRDAMQNGIADPDTGAGNVKQTWVGELEAGEFLVTTPEAFMALASSNRYGYALRGHGRRHPDYLRVLHPGPGLPFGQSVHLSPSSAT